MRKSLLLQISSIIILGFLIYANSLKGEFIWDDNALVRDDAYIKDWRHLADIFTKNTGAGAGYNSDAYRPLQTLTYLTDNAIWEGNLIGYHFTNILLHVLVGLAVYWLVILLFGNMTLAWVTSVLFIAHPVQTEAVSYISGRGDLLSALFMLLCIIFYIKQLDIDDGRLFLIMLASYTLSILAKENAVILPGLILLYHYVFKKKVKLKLLVPIAAIAFLYLFLRPVRTTALLFDFNIFLKRIPGFFVAITNYFRILFLPVGLHMEYGNKTFNFSDPKAIFGLASSLLLLIYAYKKRDANKLFSFSAGWFFIALLPHSSVYPVCAFYMAEHWLYFSSFGFFLILANGLLLFSDRINRKALFKVFIICLVSILSLLTIRQNKYWNNQISFYKRTLQYAPDSATVYYNLCQAYIEKADYKEAVMACRRAIGIKPNSPEAYCNLADAYRNLGNLREAESSYNEAIKINPTFAAAYNRLCEMYLGSNKNLEAVQICKKSLQFIPGQASTYYNMGRAYDNLGEKKNAIEAYSEAVKIDPRFLEAYNNLAAAYSDSFEAEKAIGLWNKALQIDPNFATAHFNLTVIYFRQKKYDLAIGHCDRLIALGYEVDPKLLELLKPYRK